MKMIPKNRDQLIEMDISYSTCSIKRANPLKVSILKTLKSITYDMTMFVTTLFASWFTTHTAHLWLHIYTNIQMWLAAINRDIKQWCSYNQIIWHLLPFKLQYIIIQIYIGMCSINITTSSKLLITWHMKICRYLWISYYFVIRIYLNFKRCVWFPNMLYIMT